MEARELRIGNLVETLDGVLPVENISKNINLDLVKPIPLTEEWLIKFGFNKWEGYKRWSFKNVLIYTTKTGLFYYGKKRSRTCIEYVHQLQNLYFALTGEELAINE